MSVFELLGVAFGLLSVVLTVRRSVWCWPTGIVSVVAFGVLFWQIRLYADMGLQAFYVVTGAIGWHQWLRGGAGATALPIQRLSSRGWLVIGAIAVPGTLAMGAYLSALTDASLPLVDSLASTLSVIAQLLLMRKILETWLFWIAVDVLSVGIYVVKEVHLTAGLYVLFLALAVAGLRVWRRAYRAQSEAA